MARGVVTAGRAFIPRYHVCGQSERRGKGLSTCIDTYGSYAFEFAHTGKKPECAASFDS